MIRSAIALPFFLLVGGASAVAGALFPPGDASIAGTVRSARSGEAVSGAAVRLAPERGADSVTVAGADGAFLFESLAPGRYRLSAEGAGDAITLSGEPATAEIESGAALSVDLSVWTRHALAGRVRSGASSDPAAGLTLLVRDAEGTEARAVTDAAGRFRTAAVFAPGPVEIAEARGAFGLSPGREPSPGAGDRLVLGAAPCDEASSLDLDLSMPWTARAEGRVVDSAGRPVAGALVAAVAGARRHLPLLRGGISERFARRSRTAADGTFSFDALPEDQRIEIVVEKKGYASGLSAPVLSPGGGVAAFVEIPLSLAARLAVRVEDASHAPLPGAAVALSRVELESAHLPCDPTPRAVGASGRFDFRDLAPGRYHVRVEAPPLVFSPAGPIDLAENETASIVLRPEPAALAIAGVVRDPSGAGLPPRLAVVAERLEPGLGYPAARARVDEEGRFAIPLKESGRYRLSARTTPLESGPPAEADAGEAGVELSWSPASAAIRVRVASAASGEGLAGADALVFLSDAAESPVTTWRTQDGGRSPRAVAMAPGRYEVVAAARGHAPARVVVDVAPGETGERAVEIALEPGRVVAGRVVDESGLPAAGVSVAVVAGMTPLPATTVTSGADGRFSIDSLPPSGGAVAIVRADGFRATPVDASGDDVRLVHTSRPEGAPR